MGKCQLDSEDRRKVTWLSPGHWYC